MPTLLRTHLRSSSLALGLLYLAGTLKALAAQDTHAPDADHAHRNHVALMVGGMTPLSAKSETSFALGADYERRLTEHWGIGGGVDFTFGDHKRTAIAVVGASYRVTHAFKFGTGPGVEVVDTPTSSGDTKQKLYFVWFVSASYEFTVGSLGVAPIVIVDFVGETKTNLTYGLSIGTGF